MGKIQVLPVICGVIWWSSLYFMLWSDWGDQDDLLGLAKTKTKTIRMTQHYNNLPWIRLSQLALVAE